MGDPRALALRQIGQGFVALAEALEKEPTSAGALVSHVALARELGLTSKACAALCKRAGGKRSGRVLLVRRADVEALLERDDTPAPTSSRPRVRRSSVDKELEALGFGAE